MVDITSAGGAHLQNPQAHDLLKRSEGIPRDYPRGDTGTPLTSIAKLSLLTVDDDPEVLRAVERICDEHMVITSGSYGPTPVPKPQVIQLSPQVET